MGKRLPRKELLEEIRRERDALDELLGRIGQDQWTQGGVTPSGGSVKDILAHILGWQDRMLAWHREEAHGGTPAVPAPGLTWRDLKRFNRRIHEEHRDRSLRAVLSDYRRNHERVVALVRESSESDLVRVGRFRWTGPTWTLSDFCRAQTASHYRWARKWIRPWIRRMGSGGPESPPSWPRGRARS